MIRIDQIKKSFGKQNILKGIDLEIKPGRIVGLLGPNGSGKTTLMKTILGLVIPTSGQIFVAGENIHNNWHYREKIGYMPQIAHFPENLKVKELIKLVKKMRKDTANEQTLIDLFELSPFLDKKLRNLSGGTRQKVNATLALMFDQPYRIFDEPTVGLDPYSRLQFKNHIKQERENGKTVLITTHILSEIEEIADEVVFILEGKVYFHGNPGELKIKHNAESLEAAIASITRQRIYDINKKDVVLNVVNY